MIARVDDELHARLKARAAAEGRSLNDLVTAVLTAAVEQSTTRQMVRARARVAGKLVVPDRPQHIPTHEETLAETRGLGQAASEALLAERATR
jgi:plasmid stability protein